MTTGVGLEKPPKHAFDSWRFVLFQPNHPRSPIHGAGLSLGDEKTRKTVRPPTGVGNYPRLEGGYGSDQCFCEMPHIVEEGRS
jgi:hypothetical protein